MENNAPDRYTVTIYVAAPGTPLTDPSEHGATSMPGHMFYVTDNGHNQPQSHGFAPITHGQIDGPGEINHIDVKNYQNPHYSRTIEISKEQYDKLNAFGNQPTQHGFDTYYKDARHNCVDFTWSALETAGIKSHGPHALRPNENIDAVKSISPPIPNSPLNTEHTNPMPKQGLMQKLLSENELEDAPITAAAISIDPSNIRPAANAASDANAFQETLQETGHSTADFYNGKFAQQTQNRDINRPLTLDSASALPVDASGKETTDHMLAALLSDDPVVMYAGIDAGLKTHASQQNIQQANQMAQADQAIQMQNQPVPQQVQGPAIKMS